jgi:hypothetical protein
MEKVAAMTMLTKIHLESSDCIMPNDLFRLLVVGYLLISSYCKMGDDSMNFGTFILSEILMIETQNFTTVNP